MKNLKYYVGTAAVAALVGMNLYYAHGGYGHAANGLVAKVLATKKLPTIQAVGNDGTWVLENGMWVKKATADVYYNVVSREIQDGNTVYGSNTCPTISHGPTTINNAVSGTEMVYCTRRTMVVGGLFFQWWEKPEGDFEFIEKVVGLQYTGWPARKPTMDESNIDFIEFPVWGTEINCANRVDNICCDPKPWSVNHKGQS